MSDVEKCEGCGSPPAFSEHGEIVCYVCKIQQERRERRNAARRERHAALTSLGLKRVKGSLGGIYYE